jgi:hypothetical protein
LRAGPFGIRLDERKSEQNVLPVIAAVITGPTPRKLAASTQPAATASSASITSRAVVA